MALVVILGVPVLAVGGYLGYLNHVVTSNIQQADLLPDAASSAIPPDAAAGGAGGPAGTPGPTPTLPPDTDPSEPGQGDVPAPLSVPEQSAGENYLLLGSDARAGLGGARSDVIILMHVPQDKHNVTLIHFPRDLYVSIPGRGRNKINAAFAFGGAPLLVQTLQGMLGIKIDHVALIGFEGFKRMTDAVGGVDVYVEEGGTIDGHVFTKGTMHLDGAEALAFVRERYDLSQGDISRGRRQQAFLKALMLKATSRDTITNPARLASFVDAATSNTTVDRGLDVGQMRGELISMAGLRGDDIRFITAPFSGFGRSPYGASIDIVDWTRMAALGRAIRDDVLDGYR
jgi:LCP family protein required for cell wall assembly